MLVVAVGTKNPSKLEGASRAFRAMLGGGYRLVPVAVDSGVGRQPIGLEAIVRGAVNRALNALERVKDAELGLGIEAGLFEVWEAWVDIHAAVLIGRDGFKSIGLSPGFPVPPGFVEEILRRGAELDEVADRHFGTHDIGSSEGLIALLTNRVVKRQDLVYLAVASALIPWVRRGLYQC